MQPLHLIERTIEIDAGHRATFDGSKCNNLHGHRYKITVSCIGPLIQEGPQMGMVMDFTNLKKILAEEIDQPCDHTTILWVDDPLTPSLIQDQNLLESVIRPEVKTIGYYRMPNALTGIIYLLPYVPTAENLAAHWYERLKVRIESPSHGQVKLHQVKVHESPQNAAIYPALPILQDEI